MDVRFGGLTQNNKYKKLANKYRDFYIFDKKLADEMKPREMEREEFDKKILIYLQQIKSKRYDVNKALPQTLSNGCKYYETLLNYSFNSEPKYAYYQNKIKEYLGAENYDKVKNLISIDV